MSLAVIAAFVSPLASASAGDLLLHNARIVTLDAKSTVHQALVVRDGRILATGNAAAMRATATPDATAIDLGGRTVIPGLIDSHIHAIRAGLTYTTEVSWIGARSIAEALDRIRAAASRAAPGAWIVVAGGWSERQFAELRRPSQAEVIAAAPGRPVYIQLAYRAALLTPEAHAVLGIVADGDVPPKGTLEQDSAGRRTGWIAGDGPTIVALFDRLPKPDLATAKAGTRAFFRALNRVGLTGVIDPGGHNLAPGDYAALFALQREGALTLRVAYSIFAPRPGSELADFQTMTRDLPRGLTSGDGLLRFNGIGECVTWGMYNNEQPTPAQKEAYFQVARWAAGQGLRLTQHWSRDASAHHLLEVFERVNAEIPLAPLRWSIAHVHDATPATLARMKSLGVGWLMQNALYYAAPFFLQQRGPAALATMPPIASAIAMGLPVGAGTDAHRVMDFNPFVALRWMLDGRTVEGTATRGERETPTREQALRLYTQGSAWFTGDETERGTLQPGSLADLAVLDRDFFAVPIAEIGEIEAVLTLVGGKIVYGAGDFAGLAP